MNARDQARMQSNPQLQVGGIFAQGGYERMCHFPRQLETGSGESGADDIVFHLGRMLSYM
jgi:hypothetical protein